MLLVPNTDEILEGVNIGKLNGADILLWGELIKDQTYLIDFSNKLILVGDVTPENIYKQKELTEAPALIEWEGELKPSCILEGAKGILTGGVIYATE